MAEKPFLLVALGLLLATALNRTAPGDVLWIEFEREDGHMGVERGSAPTAIDGGQVVSKVAPRRSGSRASSGGQGFQGNGSSPFVNPGPPSFGQLSALPGGMAGANGQLFPQSESPEGASDFETAPKSYPGRAFEEVDFRADTGLAWIPEGMSFPPPNSRLESSYDELLNSDNRDPNHAYFPPFGNSHPTLTPPMPSPSHAGNPHNECNLPDELTNSPADFLGSEPFPGPPTRVAVTPEPTAFLIWGVLGGLGMLAARRRRQSS